MVASVTANALIAQNLEPFPLQARTAAMQTFIRAHYKIAWESDLVKAGALPVLYIVTEVHNDPVAKETNAAFVNQFAAPDGSTKMFIEGEMSGQRILDRRDHDMAQRITAPVQFIGWDAVYQPPEGQFTPETLALFSKINRFTLQLTPQERIELEQYLPKPEVVFGSFIKEDAAKTKSSCINPIECLSQWVDHQPTTCKTKLLCYSQIFRNPDLAKLSSLAAQWMLSPEGIYKRNAILLDTLEKADIDLTQEGSFHVLTTGSAHVIHMYSFSESAVNLVHGTLRNKKVVILEPLSSYEEDPIRIELERRAIAHAPKARLAASSAQFKMASIDFVKTVLPLWHGDLTHHISPNASPFEYDVDTMYAAVNLYTTARNKLRHDTKDNIPTLEEALILEQLREEEKSSPAFLHHCFHQLLLPEENMATCLAAAQPLYSERFTQYCQLVTKQGKQAQLEEDPYSDAVVGQCNQERSQFIFQLRLDTQHAMLQSVNPPQEAAPIAAD